MLVRSENWLNDPRLGLHQPPSNVGAGLIVASEKPQSLKDTFEAEKAETTRTTCFSFFLLHNLMILVGKNNLLTM